MYIAINRFKIVPGRKNDFEKIWRERDTDLENVPVYSEFHLVKGKKRGAPYPLRISQHMGISR